MFKKKIYPIHGILLFLVLISCIALADQEVKTISYSGGFVADASAGQSYGKNFTFKSPDGLEKIYYVKAVFRLDTTVADTRFYVRLDGSQCNPNYYDIPTVEKSYHVVFDCTDVIDEEGKYEGGFQANKDIENVFGEWEFTYLNNPEVDVDKIHDIVGRELELFGTEYTAGANATAWLQLLDNESISVKNASCLLYVYYPDKSPLLTSTPMSYLEHGVYYYDFAVPEYEGVYIMTATCGWLIRHLATNTATDFVIINGTEQSGSYTDTHASDDTRHELIEETDNELPNLLAFYNFTAGNISTADIFELDIHVEYQWKYWLLFFYNPAPEVLNLEIYNYSSASWYRLPQNLSGSTTDINFDYAITGNITHFIQNDTIQLRFIDTTVDATQDQLWIDHLYIECIGKDLQYTELKGANELHVNPAYPETNYTWFEEKFNYTNILINAVNLSIHQHLDELNLTCPECANVTVNLSEVLDLIEGVNLTIMTKLYLIQDDIANLNVTIGNLTLNVTIPEYMNLTNTTINTITDDVIIKMLEHARILNDRVVNFHNTNYCIDNQTLRHNITYEYCIGGYCRVLSDIMDETCDYGCDLNRNECIPSPDVRWLYVGAVVLVISAIIIIFKRYV